MGSVVKTPGKHGFLTFLPTNIPRKLELAPATVNLLSKADRALGRLAGGGRLLPNPQLLVNAYIRREALASARIEGTQATLSDVLDVQSGGNARGDVQEVINYMAAMTLGIETLEKLPISRRLLEQLHAVVLNDVRGREKQPGTVRSTPNRIGSPNNRPDTAIFVPPPVEEMLNGLRDWEHFVNNECDLPPLVRCALMHYQFETLHPFLDGNGRLGRLLIVLFLVSEGHLPAPLLYLSAYFEEHKGDYYDGLQGVRERGDIDGWLQLFFLAIATQADDAVWRAEQLMDLRESYRLRLKGTSSRTFEVVDMLLENPIASTPQVARRVQLTDQGSTNLMRKLETQNIVTALPGRPGVANRWIAAEIYDVISGARQPSADD